MSNPVIKVENLGKEYTLGSKELGYETFREAVMRGLSAPFKRFQKLKGESSEQERFWALKEVSFEVQQGEVLGIIGRNGAGKSTLLKILSRITEPTTGRVEIRGRVASLLEVGTGFHPELTGRENIFLNGAILGMSRHEINAKFNEIVDFAEVEKFLDTPVKRYSSGMYVRLAFAVAAHLEPEILIVDEVLAVGDAAFQKKCLGKMEDVAQAGRTVLFVSHNMGTISSLCKSAILLRTGNIGFQGEVTEAISFYNSILSNSNGQYYHGYILNEQVLSTQDQNDIQLTKIEIINPSDSKKKPMTGEPLEIKIQYTNKGTWKSPAFVVSFKNIYGIELIRLSTMPISGYQIETLFTNGVVNLTLQELPLVAGIYYISIGFVREKIEWLINLDDVIECTVEPADIYKSGFFMDSSRGIFTVRHFWEHVEQ